MSLKTTPKGLLAALAALCIIFLQVPALRGGVANADRVGAHRIATSAHHAVAARAHHQRVAARTHIQPRAVTSAAPISSTGPISFVADFGPGIGPLLVVPGSSASVSPGSVPLGGIIQVTGNVTSGDNSGTPITVTLNITDAGGTRVISQSVVATTTNGAFTFNASLPATVTAGAANVVLSARGVTTGDPAELDTAGAGVAGTQPLTVLIGTSVNGTVGSAASISPNRGPRCITSTLTLTNFVPGVQVVPTYVYTTGTGAGVTTTIPLSAATPISDGTSNSGNLTTIITIPNSIPYSTTGTISFTTSSAGVYTPTLSGGFPVFTPVTPTLSAASAAPGLMTGPLGPGFTVGTSNTLNLSGTNFTPNSGITLTASLSGTPPTAVALSQLTPITAGARGSATEGAFQATALFTASVAGTYTVTASDINSCNVATTTIQVISGPVPGGPMATQYFVEGYTGTGATNGKASFKTTYDVLNPNVSSVVVTRTYLLETTNEDITTTTSAPNVVVTSTVLPALADQRFDAATDIASATVISGPNVGRRVLGTDQKFATVIQTAGLVGNPTTAGAGVQAAFGLGGIVRGVAAQRSIERTANSGARNDGDTSLGTTAANTSYYFAEGYTRGTFQEYLLLLNPSPTVTATVSVLRVPEGGATTQTPLVDGLVLAPRQRLTLNINRLNSLSPEAKVGLIVNSADNPIVAERTEYFGAGNGSSKPGESIGAGLTTAAKQLNFAYGSLTAPITSDVLGTITPTAELAQTADDRPFIEVINPNIAGQTIAGTFSGSATAPGPAAHVTIQLRGENGRLLGFFFTDVDAGARFTLTYNDLTSSSSGIGFPGVPTSAPTRAGVFSAVVSSSERVVAEEAQYFGQGGFTPTGDANSGAPGLALTGAPSGETNVLFPNLNVIDPASAQPLAHTIFLFNPGVNTTRVNGTFFGPAGVVAHQVYTVRPDAIVAIGQASSFSSGTAISPTASIPAGTTGAEFTTVQQRGPFVSGEPAQAPETFVAAQVTHSADGSQWWGTQGLYPLPTACNTPTGQPLPTGCP